jgi:hypothetical protein
VAYGLKVPEGLLNKVCERREQLIDVIERELAKLVEDPKTLGRKTPSPPFVPIGHIYDFHHNFAPADRVYVTVFFLYGPGQNQLTVWSIVVH